MPRNAFRSIVDAQPFKGRSTESAIGRMRLNYALLAASYLRSPPPGDTLVIGYNLEQRSSDLLAFDRLLFVYYADRLRALIEDAVRIFIEDAPKHALLLAPKHPSWQQRPITVESIRPAVERAGDNATRGSYNDIAGLMSDKFGITIFSSAELRYLTYIAETRNLIVHRGEIVDERFVERSGSGQLLGSEVKLPSVPRMAIRVITLPAKIETRLSEWNRLHA